MTVNRKGARAVNFGGVEENVVSRDDFSLDDARDVLRDCPIAILGYGPQGQGQGLNLRDNGFNVCLGLRERYSEEGKEKTGWEKALEDGWKPEKNLFSIEKAASRGVIVANLISDAGQVATWEKVKPHLTRGKAFYVSHGMPLCFHEQTGIVPPDGVDVIMVAPKGAGSTVRSNFMNGSGINSSYAIERDCTGKAFDRARAMGIGIGSGYMFGTTADKEAISDHVGERFVLLGGTAAAAEVSFQKEMGHPISPELAFQRSSEQLTQVIIPLIGKGGAGAVYEQARASNNLETLLAHQLAALKACRPTVRRLYEDVVSGKEAATALRENSAPDYRERLKRELDELDGAETWQAGTRVRRMRLDRTYGGRIKNWPLVGTLLGMIEAQFEVLTENGHSPSEAFNETVEELTQSLNKPCSDYGAAGLMGRCSTTAQRGALDWRPKFYLTLAPVFFGRHTYDGPLDIEPNHTFISGPNMWEVGEKVRELRPENQVKKAG
jgi:ketol-acid reductoisomerase